MCPTRDENGERACPSRALSDCDPPVLFCGICFSGESSELAHRDSVKLLSDLCSGLREPSLAGVIRSFVFVKGAEAILSIDVRCVHIGLLLELTLSLVKH